MRAHEIEDAFKGTRRKIERIQQKSPKAAKAKRRNLKNKSPLHIKLHIEPSGRKRFIQVQSEALNLSKDALSRALETESKEAKRPRHTYPQPRKISDRVVKKRGVKPRPDGSDKRKAYGGLRLPGYQSPKIEENITASDANLRQHYTFVRRLGEGGQGEVNSWSRRSDQTLIAVKSVEYDHISQASREAKLLSHLRDAGGSVPIMKLYECKLEHIDGRQRLNVMSEYCSGGDLSLFLARIMKLGTTCPESFLWHVYLQLSEALAFLHYGTGRKSTSGPWKTIIHRDIKHENVFLQYAGEGRYPLCRLGDFEHARFDRDWSSDTVGTPVWHPPEQWTSPTRAKATMAGDVWATGCVIHALATGKIPGEPDVWAMEDECDSEDGTRRRTVFKIDEAYWGYSSTLQECLELSLKKDPEQRIAANRLVESIEAVVKNKACDKPDIEILSKVHKSEVTNWQGTLFVWNEDVDWDLSSGGFSSDEEMMYGLGGRPFVSHKPLTIAGF